MVFIPLFQNALCIRDSGAKYVFKTNNLMVLVNRCVCAIIKG